MNKKKTNNVEKNIKGYKKQVTVKMWMNDKYTTFEKFFILLVIWQIQIQIGNNMSYVLCGKSKVWHFSRIGEHVGKDTQ